MADLLRRILYPAFVATIIVTIWVMAEVKAGAEAVYNRTYWPAINNSNAGGHTLVLEDSTEPSQATPYELSYQPSHHPL